MEDSGRVTARFGGASRRYLLVAVLAAAVSLTASSSALATAPKATVNSIGAPAIGETGALFNTPRDIAINQDGAGGVPAGTFYVVDALNRRIQRFGPSGDFVSAWGWGVDKGNAEFGICTDPANCARGSAGNRPGQLSNSFSQGIAVDQDRGTVYVSDQANRRVNVFSSTGAFEGAFGWGVKGEFDTELQFCTAVTGCGQPQQQAAEGTPLGACGMFGTAIGGIAVGSGGEVFVANKSFARIDVFQPILSGNVVTGIECLRTFGWNVVEEGPDDTVADAFEVCDVAANPSDVCRSGATGPGIGQFATNSPVDLALDSDGNLFAVDNNTTKRVQKFDASSQPADAAFGAPTLTSVFGTGELLNVSVDPSTDHVFVSGKRSASSPANRLAVAELDESGANAVEGGGAHGEDLPVNSGATATALGGLAIAKPALGGNLYVSLATTGTLQGVYVLNATPTMTEVAEVTGTSAVFRGEVVSDGIDVEYHFEYSIDGSAWTSVPAIDVNAGSAPGKIDVEQEATNLTGSQHYFVRLVQNRPTGGGVAASAPIEFTTAAAAPAGFGVIAWPIKDTSATLNAFLNPQNEATSYRFEYGTSACSAIPSPCTSLPAAQASGGGQRLIAQTVTGLLPSTAYHYRLVATNATGTFAGPDRVFETFAPDGTLVDDRGYELVTPGETGVVVLGAADLGGGSGDNCFNQLLARPDGNSLLSISTTGSLPAMSGNGTLSLYESVRGPAGWTTLSRSPTGAQSEVTDSSLCSSPDHLYSTLVTGAAPNDEGSLVVNGQETSYLRRPDGGYTLVGQGTEGMDPEANVRWITAQGGHVVFISDVHLEPDAPPNGTEAIYDRAPNGQNRVVSMAPSGAPLADGEDAEYQGVSEDGSSVAYKLAGTMYVRAGSGAVKEVSPTPSTFAGLSADGDTLFYADAPPHGRLNLPDPADLFAFDVANGASEQIAPSSIFVNVSSDGSHVYFTSTSVLTGLENSQGRSAEAGENNLYVWDDVSKAPRFIAVVSDADLVDAVGGPVEPGLAYWTTGAVWPETSGLTGRANDPSRTTPDGTAFLFESNANITGYDSGGRVEIYRYDAGSADIDCVSCPGIGVPAGGDARLQVLKQGGGLGVTSSLVHIQNVTDDGAKVFFQTEDALVPTDVNGTWDVYEWKEGQQAYPITPGRSSDPSLLYSMTPNGSDLFFASRERLVSQDLSSVTSIYDARVGGGFPESDPENAPCQGDACQGTLSSPAPPLPNAGSATFQGAGNETRKIRRCPRNARRIKRNGKVRCLRKSRSRARSNRRAGNNRGAGR